MSKTEDISGDSTRGAIDADGHVLEPIDLWQCYLEPKYRDRAIRTVKLDDGFEQFVWDSQLSASAES